MIIDDCIYIFEYLNNQGQTIQLKFVPNVCVSHSPTEIRLIENIFEIKTFKFGFEKDYIKDKVCGQNVSTLEVEVNFSKLNRLALEDEHYMNILECILNYKIERPNCNIYNTL